VGFGARIRNAPSPVLERESVRPSWNTAAREQWCAESVERHVQGQRPPVAVALAAAAGFTFMTTSRSTGSRRRRPPWRTARRPRGVPTLGYASAPVGAALDGPEIEAQRLEIESACQRLGLELVDLVRDQEPDRPDAEGRPGLSYALDRIEAGEASCLIVSDLERLSRQVPELAALVDRLERARVRLIAIDVGLDTATPRGRLAVTRQAGLDAAEVEEHEGEAEAATVPAEADPAAAEPVPPEPVAAEPTDDEPSAPEAAPAGIGADRQSDPDAREALRALGYASVPPDGGRKQLAAQQRAIVRRAHRLGLELVEVVRDREPKTGKALDRAGLSYLIERLAAGDAKCVIVSGLERVSRSVAELGTVVEWLEENEVRLIVADLDLDTASQSGRSTARALASVAGWERERLVDRTRKGLAAARAKRRAAPGPSSPDWEAIKEQIAAMRAEGMTLQAIADELNREGVPTQRGGTEWRPSSVQTAAGYKRPPRPRRVDELPKVDRPDPPADS
jgi:DNA invertase Pin-like site-specific DNA recombinase